MELRRWMMTAIGAAGLTLMAAGAQAAMLNVNMEAGASSVEQASKRCWSYRGVRHCDRTRRNGSRSGYRVHNIPEAYPTGSSRWWQEMDRQDRGGRGGRG